MDLLKAIKFVEETGTALDKYRLSYLLGKGRDEEVPLRILRGIQNPDGGFPYKDEKGKASCMQNTSSNLGLLIELELKDSDVCRRAVEYLLRAQGEDGGWDENAEIRQYDPPFWDAPGDLKTRMWLTADICVHLIKLGYEGSEVVRKAADYLVDNRDADGRFFGFINTMWIAVAVFG